MLRSWWIILLCAVIALAVAFEVDKRMTNTYQGTTYVLLELQRLSTGDRRCLPAGKPAGSRGHCDRVADTGARGESRAGGRTATQ